MINHENEKEKNWPTLPNSEISQNQFDLDWFIFENSYKSVTLYFLFIYLVIFSLFLDKNIPIWNPFSDLNVLYTESKVWFTLYSVHQNQRTDLK